MEAKKKFVINIAFYGIVLALLAAAYQYILPILMPFVIGFCVASLVRLIQRKMKLTNEKYARPLSVILCIVIYVIIVGLIALLSSTIVTQISDLAKALPGLFDTHVYPFLIRLAQYVQTLLSPFDPDVVDYIMELGRSVAQSLGQFATNLSASVVKWVANGAAGVPGLIIQIVLTVVSTFYFAADYHTVIRFLGKMIPESRRDMIIHTLRYTKSAVVGYIKSYSIMFVLTFIELTIGFLIMRIPYAVAIALGIAVFDLMPVLGTGGILLPWAVVLLFMRDWPMAIGMVVLYVVIAIVRNAVEPRIVGERIGLHPLATLMAMILGLRLMGLLGMFCFPVGLVVYTNYKKNKKEAVPSV